MNLTEFINTIADFNFDDVTQRQLIQRFVTMSGKARLHDEILDPQDTTVKPPAPVLLENTTICYRPLNITEAESAADSSVPKRDFEDLGILGRGGMGEVRLVLDKRLNRRLAMKILHGEMMNDALERARFIEEAQVSAQLQHPNIVPIHEVGALPDGRLYFTMKAVNGRRLSDVIKAVHAARVNDRFEATEKGWTFHRLIDVVHQVCQAVAFAHSKGVLHRDLKPSNIMLGKFGEVLVLDWGIAKVLGKLEDPLQDNSEDEGHVVSGRDSLHITRMGQVTGTPAYMAPEQALGQIDKLNTRTDIYALGAILYEILSGQPPYTGSSPLDTLEQVRSGPPQTLRNVLTSMHGKKQPRVENAIGLPRFQVPEVLVEACDIAMSRQQGDRYSSAEVLGGVLRAWLEGAKRRERALAIVRETESLTERCRELRTEAAQLLELAAAGLKEVPKWADESMKGAHWALERQGLAKQRASRRIGLDIEHRLQSALSHKADLVEAHEALGQRYLTAHQEAETVRDVEAIDLNEIRLRHHASFLPRDNAFRKRVFHYLKGTGAVSLTTDVEGVDIFLEEYIPHHRRLIPKPIAYLGNQGLHAHSLEMGSYRLVLKKEGHHDVMYPVHIRRGAHWDGRDENGIQRAVHIPKLGDIREDECFVPGGWFWCGGDAEAMRGFSARKVWVDDFVMSRFQVTNRDYLNFLNSLLDQGREEEAFQWVPRERAAQAGELGAMIYGRGDDGRFMLVVDADGDLWEPDWPVMMVNWHCAKAYCRWESETKSKGYRLPSEFEWEKAARGVDGRRYVWGNGFDPSYCHMVESHRGRNLPASVQTHAIDESVYGVRGLAGNTMDWTSSRYRLDWDDTEKHSEWVRRGGNWMSDSRYSRAALRGNVHPSLRVFSLGFRLARSLSIST